MKHTLFGMACLLLVMASGCRKFKHTTAVPDHCEMCAHADSLEGSYIGVPWGTYVGGSSTNGDSLRVTVEHVFMDHGNYLDSTVMYFKVNFQFVSQSLIRTTSLRMYTPDRIEGWAGFDTLILTPPQLHIHDEFISHYNPAPQLHMEYTGIRE